MKMADGGFRPAYNVQFATDTKSTAIAGVSVDNTDMGKMLPMNDALAGQYGTRPRQHLADGGFAKTAGRRVPPRCWSAIRPAAPMIWSRDRWRPR
jgi:hypothetical protein